VAREPSAPRDALSADVRDALERSSVLYDADTIERTLDRMAVRITLALEDSHPIVVCVMSGGLVVTADLLRRLRFPLELDYLHVTRYAETTRGGELVWHALPRHAVAGRVVLLVDDILDVGVTLAASVSRLTEAGATAVRTAVLVKKRVTREVTLEPDFWGLEVPDRYVFGRGMDYRGHWRNLAEIRVLSAADTAASEGTAP
jgi:hypoxanthine phosphoribosyltransferase